MHKFSPENAQRLERPDRYLLIPPDGVLRRFGLRPGMRFLDVGAGTGFFSRAAAAIVRPTGTVCAIDTSPAMLEILRAGVQEPAVEVLLSEEYAIPLPDRTADMALLAFVLHETPDRQRLLGEVMRILKTDGTLLVIEWKKQEEEKGPPMEERLGEMELTAALEHYAVIEEGSLNDSHYYKVIRRGPGLSV